LVLGGGDDPLIPVGDVVATARAYGTQAHVFRGMGHDLMLDARWRQPLDLMLDWLERSAV
jgi:pimeloyl-ACP methyl ester carboxylesterase